MSVVFLVTCCVLDSDNSNLYSACHCVLFAVYPHSIGLVCPSATRMVSETKCGSYLFNRDCHTSVVFYACEVTTDIGIPLSGKIYNYVVI